MDFTVSSPVRPPAPVRPGAHIRLVSPAMPTISYIPERTRRAEQVLRDHGYTVSYGANAFQVSADGMTAGTAEQRAADFMAAFTDPEVDVVLASDAGQGSQELIDLLDPDAIAANAKPFVGYCDNVYLNAFLARRAGISSLYGISHMVHIGEAGGAYPETLRHLAEALASDEPLVCEAMPDRTGALIDWYVPEREREPRGRDIAGGWTWLRPGTARGPLWGGEISILPDLVTDFGLELDGAVLFWDISYHGLPVGPLFEALCERVDLTGLAGMLIGAHPLMPLPEWARIVGGLVDRLLPAAGYPIVVNTDLGHTCPSWIVPYGEEVAVAADRIVFPRRQATPATSKGSKA
ncbi:LD-carboxypeptidase [Actinoplanes sp. NPDC049681]|uniref:LD-carboxypeptidase n=1 Tax=Actinoplanes sp. NPDC049681 TaxID=3363905 RepID=UPI0037BE08E1